MNLMLHQSRYRPIIYINISDDYDVYKTGKFEIHLSTPAEALNNHKELMSTYWEDISDHLCNYYKVSFFNSFSISFSTLKRAIASLNYQLIIELITFSYILNNCNHASLLIEKDNTFKLVCPNSIINELKSRMDVTNFIPLESCNLLNGAA